MTTPGKTRGNSPRAVARSALEVLLVATWLGITSFGGPVAHLGHFERAYVGRLRWLSREEYAGLLALCQLLPGPTSSQVGFLVGMHRAGWWGALAAWFGFTLPSALLLYFAATLETGTHGAFGDAVVHGLKLVAVPVVAHAVLGMARQFCSGAAALALAVLSVMLALTVAGDAQWLLIVVGAAGGAWLMRDAKMPNVSSAAAIGRSVAWVALALYVALLIILPLLARLYPDSDVAIAERFYRSGALVFGGGHVVLPMLRDALVPIGWVDGAQFLTAYGLAQAVPGPMFTIAAWLGASTPVASSSSIGAAVAVVAIFLPGLLLAVAGVPVLHWVAGRRAAAGSLAGINAAVVGLLAAALYDPIWVGAIGGPQDVLLSLLCLLMLQRIANAPVLVVLLCVGASVITGIAS